MLRFLPLLSLGLFGIRIVAAQEPTPTWTLTDVQPLSEVIGADYKRTALPFLSPDGSAIAITENNGLKIYTFADQQVTAYPWPDEYRGYGRFSGTAWSPDGSYIAFTESMFDLAIESDLWLVDEANREIRNGTDDGIVGGLLRMDETVTLDYLPTWNPANGDLYFFRSVRSLDGDTTTELYLFPIERGEPKLVHDLTGEFPVFSLYRAAVISPNGSHMALIVLPSKPTTYVESGIWVLDIKSGSLKQVADLDELKVGLPDWIEGNLMLPETVQWAGNDALVVLTRDSQSATSIGQMAYYIDLPTRNSTPLVNFNDVDHEQELFEDNGAASPVYRIPRSGVVSPDGSVFLFVRWGLNQERAGVSAVPLPPNGLPQVELADVEDWEIVPVFTPPAVMSADGKALMYGYLFQFEPAA